MAFPGSLDTALAEAAELAAALEQVIIDLVSAAQEKNLVQVQTEETAPDSGFSDVRVLIALKSEGVPSALVEKLEGLFALTRGS
jgi:hypothetical protein